MDGATPYKDKALAHFDKGWAVFPAAPGGKEPLVKGRSGGYQSVPVKREVIEREAVQYDKANIGIRIPDDMIVLDLDLRVDEATGEIRADGLESFWGLDLPPTIGLAHQPEDATGAFEDLEPNDYRHHFYRVPEGVTPNDIALLKDSAGGVDLLRWMHRLTVGAGSVHKSGERYRWVRPDGTVSRGIPRPEDATRLSDNQWARIVEFFGQRSHVDGYTGADVDVDEWMHAHDGEPTTRIRQAVAVFTKRAPDAQRHAAAGLAAYRVAQEAEDGESGAQRALWFLRDKFIEAVSDRSSEAEADAEWYRLLSSAIAKAVAKTEAGDRDGPTVLEGVTIPHPKGKIRDRDGTLVDAGPEKAAWRQRKDDAYSVGIGVKTYEFVREYLDRHHPNGVLKFVNTAFWRWDDGLSHWVRFTDGDVRHWVSGDLRGAFETTEDAETRPISLKPKNVSDVLSALKDLTNDHPVTPTGGVPFANGWLDMRTGRLLPPSPERFNTWVVPTDYSPEAPYDEWVRFLSSLEWTPDSEEYRTLRQWFGYLLSGENHRQRALLLHGPTRSGKGTILAMAYRLLGEGATGLRLKSLGETFGLQPLLGKGLAVIGDARFTAKIDTGVVEALLSLTGKDPQSVNVKNKDQVSTRLPTRLMIATNDRPVFTESSNALAMRFVILHMNPSFLGREDLDLEDRLATQLAGIARWALDGYKDLNEVGHFSPTEAGTRMSEDFVRDSAPLRYFVEDMCEVREGVKVTNDALYTAYALWCEASNMHPLNRVHFMRELLTAYEGQIVEGRSGGIKVKKGITLQTGTVTA